MTELLIRLFVGKNASADDPRTRTSYGVLSGFVGIAVNVILTAAKFAVGSLTGSISITADAINNLSDAGSSVVTLVGFKMAKKPADREHPYGHGRIEYISALIVSFLVLLMGVELLKSSVEKIKAPDAVTYSTAALAVLIISILFKLWLAYFNYSVGKRIDSTANKAVVADSLSDTAATAAALISLIISKFSSVPVDGWFGLVVSGFIIYSGIGIIKDTVSPLLGQPPKKEFVKQIEDEILSYPNIVGVHDLIIHDYGPGRRFASAHVEMDYREDVLDAHECIDEMEREVRKTLGVELVIHYDPIVTDDEELSRIHTQVAEILQKVDPKLTVHDFRMVRGNRHTNVIFDLVLPFSMEDRKQELRELVERELQTDGKEYHAVITFDTQAFNAPDDPCDDPEKT